MILNKFFGKFQLKIKNRESAGNILAGTLKDILKKVDGSNVIVVGLPRGGFVIAEIIARKLSCNLDMIISKRLRSPNNEEIAIGAVAEDGTTYLNKTLIEELNISDEYLDKELSYQLQEIRRLSAMYYQGKKTLLETNYITDNNKTIIIVDDGAATGSTIIAASRSLRKKYNPTFIIVAITVSPKGTIDLLKKEGIDHIEVITNPNDSNFETVEQFYQNFDQVRDNEILNILHTIRK